MNIQTFVFSPFQENTYVLWNDNKEAIIVDPGCFFPQEELELKTFIESEKLHVHYLINTHLHLDHIFGNRFVEKTWNIGTSACEMDAFWLKDFTVQCRTFGLTPPSEAPQLSQTLHEGDCIELGNEQLHILEVPGHSPGSIVLLNKKDGFALVGDVLFKNSIGRSDFNGGDQALLIRGIQEKLLTLPDETIIYSGHGPTTTIGYERNSNPFI